MSEFAEIARVSTELTLGFMNDKLSLRIRVPDRFGGRDEYTWLTLPEAKTLSDLLVIHTEARKENNQ